MTNEVFSAEQKNMLDKKLNPKFVSERKGGSNKILKYIEGHDAIDQANRIFGYGNWAYRPLACEQSILVDPLTGEAVGIAYKAQVELTVMGCIAPIVEVGSQPVAVWSVDDQILSRRMNDAKYNKKPLDESPFTPLEKSKARAVIVEAHEQAEKGAVTDALKRALRTFGEQFGNGLYGDGRIIVDDDQTYPPATKPQPKPQNQTPPRQLIPTVKPDVIKEEAPATPQTGIPTVAELQAQCATLFGPGKWKASLARILPEVQGGDLDETQRRSVKRNFDVVVARRAEKQAS